MAAARLQLVNGDLRNDWTTAGKRTGQRPSLADPGAKTGGTPLCSLSLSPSPFLSPLLFPSTLFFRSPPLPSLSPFLSLSTAHFLSPLVSSPSLLFPSLPFLQVWERCTLQRVRDGATAANAFLTILTLNHASVDNRYISASAWC